MSFCASLFCSCVYLAANSCAMWALFSVFRIVEGAGAANSVLLLWVLCIAACCCCLHLFLSRERSERSLICFCAAFLVLQLVLSFVLCRFWPGFTPFLICLAMWLYSYYSCFELCSKKISAEKLNKSFDLCCLVLVFVLFFCSVKGTGLMLVLPLALSTVASLFALITVRSGEQRKFRGLLMGGGLVLVFAALSSVVVSVASGGVGKLVSGLLSILRSIGLAANSVFLFLLSLFPEKQYDYDLPAPEEGLSQLPVQDMSFELVDPNTVIIAVLSCVLVIVLAAVISRLVRGRGTRRVGAAGFDTGISRRRLGLAAMLKKAIQSLGAALRFRLLCITRRNTAPGLLMEIEKRSRAQLHGRGESESCREFLKRAVIAYPHAEAQLLQLADAVDAHCFGGCNTLESSQIIALRNHIFKKNTESH